jgi:hydrogenase expression/formation protein HypD
MDALAMARAEPERILVFFGLGFETTMPSTALTVLQAAREGIRNFALFCNHITIIPTIQALLDDPGLRIDGFLGPGHVTMVIGTEPYRFVAERHSKPLVVSGFEPLDVLQSLWMVLKQMRDGRAEIENQYARVARDAGSRAAQDAVAKVFELREFFEWRGLGSIPHSGVRLREAYAAWDAERRFLLPNLSVADPESCQCGEVLTGRIRPRDCRVFGTECTPATPLGALMVSSEGACAAYHRYGALAREAAPA